MKTVSKLLLIIPDRFKSRIILLILLLIFAMFLEIIGIGLIVPILSFFVDETKGNFIFKLFNDYLGIFDKDKILYFLISFLILTFIFKTVFLTYLNYKQNQFFSNIKVYLTDSLYKRYILKPYSFYLKNNISVLIKNISKEIQIVHSLGLTFLSIAVEGSMILAASVTIIYIDPLGALTLAFFLFISSFLFFKFYKKKIFLLGEKRKVIDTNLSSIYYESFTNIKELKSFYKESRVIDEHNTLVKEQGKLTVFVDFIIQSPRYFLELISILGLMSFIVINIFFGKDINSLIVSIGVFVTAIFKMLPSVNKLLSVSQSINYNKPALDLIYNEFKDHQEIDQQSRDQKITFKNQIELKNIKFRYSKNTAEVLKGISLTITKGDIVGIIGESGSGKSTLVDILLGLLNPTEGEILIDNKKFQPLKYSNNLFAYVPQTINLMDKSLKENILFFEDRFYKKNYIEAIKNAELREVIKNLPKKDGTIIGDKGNNLSGGQRQRIGIARAILCL